MFFGHWVKLNMNRMVDTPARLVLWGFIYLLAFACRGEELVLKGEAQIVFQGRSTLHDFSGKVSSQPFVINALRDENGRITKWSSQADVSASTMDTTNKDRDKNMHKMLDAANYTFISGTVSNAPAPVLGSSNSIITLTLKIRDKCKTIPVEITDWHESAKELAFSASWTVSLKDYGLKPPSVLGIIKVNDTVALAAKIQARK